MTSPFQSSRRYGVEHVPTIDQVLAYSSKFYPTLPRLRSLHVGSGFGDSFSWTNYGIEGGEPERISLTKDPWDAWDDVFGGFTPPEEGRDPATTTE